jgi:uncharacterized protein
MREHSSWETALANQYLYRLKLIRLGILSEGPTEHEAAILADHVAHLERLTSQGEVVMAGRTLTTDESTFGIVVFFADSNDAAIELMQSDPAVSGGVMTAELFPFRVSLWSTQSPLDGA